MTSQGLQMDPSLVQFPGPSHEPSKPHSGPIKSPVLFANKSKGRKQNTPKRALSSALALVRPCLLQSHQSPKPTGGPKNYQSPIKALLRL